MKRYKLVKNLPTFKKGTKFHINADGDLVLDNSWIVAYAKSTLERFPKILKDWFEEIPELKRWRGEYGETYWFLSDNGSLYSKTEDNSKIDNYRYLVGNYFKTIEEAKAYKKYLLARQVLLDDTDGGKWSEDDGNFHVFRCGTVMDVTNSLFYRPGTIFSQSAEALRKSLEIHGKQWDTVLEYETREMQ